MEYVALGRTGLKVSRLCLGMMTYGDPAWRDWVLPEAPARGFVERALAHGINFFDTADMYSRGVSEEILGRAVRDFSRRSDVVIATKVYYPTGDGPNDRGLSRKHIFDSCEQSLRRLQTDFIDLYQIHRADPTTPIEETLRALDDLVRAGKVRYLGASSMFAWQFARALGLADRHGWTRFATMQNHYNLVYREEEREMLPLCREEGIGVIPWSPLARGFLAGNRRTRDRGDTTRARGRHLCPRALLRPVRLHRRRSCRGRGPATRGEAGAGGARLAAAATGGDRTNHRRQQAGASRGCRPRCRTAIDGRRVR